MPVRRSPTPHQGDRKKQNPTPHQEKRKKKTRTNTGTLDPTKYPLGRGHRPRRSSRTLQLRRRGHRLRRPPNLQLRRRGVSASSMPRLRLLNLRRISCLPVPPCNRRSDRSNRGNRRPAPCAATADRGGHGTTTSTQCELLKAPSPFSLSPPVGSKSCTTSCRRGDTSERRTCPTSLAVATPPHRPSCLPHQQDRRGLPPPVYRRRRKWQRRRAVHVAPTPLIEEASVCFIPLHHTCAFAPCTAAARSFCLTDICDVQVEGVVP
jgi:hypothetical protein